MTNTQKSIIALTVLGATVLGAGTALAAPGEGKGPRGDREGLVPTELRQEYRAQMKAEFENMTDEERQAFKQEMREARKAQREERRENFASFVGLSVDELKEAKESGQKLGDVLTSQGITESDAETFLTDQANARVDAITERFELSEEDEQTIRDRIAEFVQKKLDKWFGTTTS